MIFEKDKRPYPKLARALSPSRRGEVRITDASLGILTWSTMVVGPAVASPGVPWVTQKKEKKKRLCSTIW